MYILKIPRSTIALPHRHSLVVFTEFIVRANNGVTEMLLVSFQRVTAQTCSNILRLIIYACYAGLCNLLIYTNEIEHVPLSTDVIG
jgi:hypothetical protein